MWVCHLLLPFCPSWCCCIVKEPPLHDSLTPAVVHFLCLISCASISEAAMASLLHLHLHRLCLTPSNAGSLRLLFRRSFAHDVKLDSTEKAAKKVQEEAKKTKGQTKSVADKIKQQAEKELTTARDMAKDIPKKTKEAAKGVKELGVDAAKAVKRDAEKVAEKVGIKEKKSRD